MPRPICIHIPMPCSQNWDDMTPDDSGRHCAQCNKTVIDFTTWSDAALYNYFSKNTGHVCGRFLASQVDRPINIPYQPHSRLYRMTMALGLTLLFTQTPHLLAQNTPRKIEQTNAAANAFDIDSVVNETAGIIAGRIFDDKKQPLPSAVVQIFQDGVLAGGNVTDYDGYYTIKSLKPGRYDVLIQYAGYDSVSLKGMNVSEGATTTIDASMISNVKALRQVYFVGYRKPLVDRDNPSAIQQMQVPAYNSKCTQPLDDPDKHTFTSDQVNNMPH